MSDWQKCCKGRKSCPHVKIDGNIVSIKDDDDNVVTMTLDQLQDVYLQLHEFLSQNADFDDDVETERIVL